MSGFENEAEESGEEEASDEEENPEVIGTDGEQQDVSEEAEEAEEGVVEEVVPPGTPLELSWLFNIAKLRNCILQKRS